jgi:hypothetical protein
MYCWGHFDGWRHYEKALRNGAFPRRHRRFLVPFAFATTFATLLVWLGTAP